MKTLIIAEAGVNHNGSVELAKKLVDAAKLAGADCIKFQTFVAEDVVTDFADTARYQKNNIKESASQKEMLKKLELSFDDFIEVKKYCDLKNIMFVSTAFDLSSIDFLSELDMPFWKIPSGEITNYPYLRKIAKMGKPIVMSTGMCTISEIDDALKLLRSFGSRDISILHCTTEYPAPYNEVNLNAILSMAERYKIPVGYSDHTNGILASVAAVAMGASIIEKHFTLDKNMEGPDHKASLSPNEFEQMVRDIRTVETMLGDGKKCVVESERDNQKLVRKSIVAKKDIAQGEVFSEENITTKRPGTGINPMNWEKIIGKCADRDYKVDEKIENMGV